MTPQQLKAMKMALEALEDRSSLMKWQKARDAIKEVLAEHAMREAQRLGQEIEQEPLEYWNAVEGWVKIDEVREHFDSVGCATIYKTAGEGRVPLCLAQPEQEPVATDWNAVHEKLGLVWFRELSADEGLDEIQDLINTTPPQRTWVGLTPEQIQHRIDTHIGVPSPKYPLDNSDLINFALVIADELKGKNK